MTRPHPLKQIEIEIIQALANGDQLKEIAHAQQLPISTVHSTVQRVRGRMKSIRTTAGLVAFAMRKGWIQ